MISSTTLGQYIPGQSLLHRLNPRIKLVSMVVLLISLLLLKTFLGLGLFALLIVGLYLGSGLPLRNMISGLRPILYIALLTLIIYAVSTKGGVVLIRVGGISVESQGISGGLFVVSRLILLIWVTLLLTFTTTPLSLVGGLEYLLKPLEHLKLPAAEIALVMTIALRFIPTLMEESQRIMKAQVSRGVNFDLGGIAHKVRNLAPLVIPLFIGAFRRADEVALAMEARGYRVGVRRTSLKERKTGALDRLSLVCALSVLAVTIFAGL